MVRHDKRLAMKNVPLPLLESLLFKPGSEEKSGYNNFLSFVRSNVVLTSLQGKEKTLKQESLLEAPKHLRDAFANLQMVCNGRWEFDIRLSQCMVLLS